MSNKIYIDDVGTDIILDCGQDIQAATVTTIKVKKPDGESYEWTGAIHNNNYIKYTVIADDLDQAGTYLVQSYVETPSWQGHGETVSFEVHETFK